LLAAYRAKAAAVGHIENPDVAELVDDAHNELYTAPADLDRAQTILTRLAETISHRSEARS